MCCYHNSTSTINNKFKRTKNFQQEKYQLSYQNIRLIFIVASVGFEPTFFSL